MYQFPPRVLTLQAAPAAEPITLAEAKLFLRVSVTYDDIGGQVESWSEVATVWAKVEELDGDKKFTNRHRSFQQRFKITVRALESISVTQRLRYRDQTLYILSLKHGEPLEGAIQIVAENRKR